MKDPPPAEMVKVTGALGTGIPSLLVTNTERGFERTKLVIDACPFPPRIAIVSAEVGAGVGATEVVERVEPVKLSSAVGETPLHATLRLSESKKAKDEVVPFCATIENLRM